MYIEIRTYQLKNGTVPQYLKIIGEQGIEIQKRYLGNLVGYYYSEIGPINQIVHIWAYGSLDEREVRRAKLIKDPAWQKCLGAFKDFIISAENKIMKAADFSPLP